MAKLNDIVFKVDHYFTDTRLIFCDCTDCKNHDKNTFTCKLKEVRLTRTGYCNERIY